MKTTQAFLREFNDAFATNDQDFILDNLSNDIEWNMVGGAKMKGKDEVRKELQQMGGVKMLDMETLHIICEDHFAAVDGRMRMLDQSGAEKSYAYCDVYEFEGPRIKKMTSYVKEIETS